MRRLAAFCSASCFLHQSETALRQNSLGRTPHSAAATKILLSSPDGRLRKGRISITRGLLMWTLSHHTLSLSSGIFGGVLRGLSLPSHGVQIVCGSFRRRVGDDGARLLRGCWLLSWRIGRWRVWPCGSHDSPLLVVRFESRVLRRVHTYSIDFSGGWRYHVFLVEIALVKLTYLLNGLAHIFDEIIGAAYPPN